VITDKMPSFSPHVVIFLNKSNMIPCSYDVCCSFPFSNRNNADWRIWIHTAFTKPIPAVLIKENKRSIIKQLELNPENYFFLKWVESSVVCLYYYNVALKQQDWHNQIKNPTDLIEGDPSDYSTRRADVQKPQKSF